MKVAIIPPLRGTNFGNQTEYHLVLPHLVSRSVAYGDAMRERSGFKMMDNGAAEGEKLAAIELLELSTWVGVDEIVVPDALYDWFRTVELAKQFEKYAEDWLYRFDFALVLQGMDYKDFVHCFMAYEHNFPWATTLMLPRLMVGALGVKEARMNFLSAFYDQIESRFRAVHLLGSSQYTDEVKLLREVPIVRGIDTSMPIAMGLEDKDIAVTSNRYTPHNGKDYFDTRLEDLQTHATRISRNIRTFRYWAGDYEEASPSQV